MPRVKSSETATATASTAAVATPVVAKAPKAPKAPKAEKPAAAAAPATPLVETAAAPAATPKKSAKKEKTAAAAAAPAAATEVVSATEAAPAAEVVAAAEAAPSEFSDFMAKLQQLTNLVNTLKSEFRSLEKKASKDLKTVAKANAKRKRKNVNRAPSGFVKPTLISSELAVFLGKAAGTEMARTEVTREINAYIREHKLQDKSNGRVINADTKLSALLKIPTGEELTYFNLQRYMSPHFTKVAATATA
jgi:chromatin remodeling complex protein RSC6